MGRPNRPSYFPSRACWRFRLAGRAHYVCKGVRPDQKPAREGIPRVVWDAMDRLVVEREGRTTAGSDPTIFWVIEQYLEWLNVESAADRITRKQYLDRCSQLAHVSHAPEIGPIRPVALSAQVTDDLFTRFRSSPLPGGQGPPSAHYVHNVGAAFRAALRWAARPVAGRVPARLIASNPLADYGWPKAPGAVRGYVEAAIVRRFLRWAWARARWADNDRLPGASSRARGLKPEPGTVRSLKRRFDRVFVLMIRFQRLTGCRPGESCGLRWSEIAPAPGPGVRWEPVVITIDPARVKTRHQTDRARKIWVTPPVARILRALHRLPGRHPEVVFPHMRGKGAELRGSTDALAGEPWPDSSAASRKLGGLRAAALAEHRGRVPRVEPGGHPGLTDEGPTKLIAYANRHGFASEVASAGFSDGQVAEQMGNTPGVMRKVYAHTIEDHAADRAREIVAARRSGGKRK